MRQVSGKLDEAASSPRSITLGLTHASAVRYIVAPVHRQIFWAEDVETGTHRIPAYSQSPAMALGRVLLSIVLLLGLYNADALSLDLEGLKDQAVTQITGPRLMEIVRIPLQCLHGKHMRALF